MYALLLEKLQIGMKYFCEPLYVIYDYISKVAIKEFIIVFFPSAVYLMYMEVYVYNSIYMLY